MGLVDRNLMLIEVRKAVITKCKFSLHSILSQIYGLGGIFSEHRTRNPLELTSGNKKTQNNITQSFDNTEKQKGLKIF